jgi:signal transduction histidine kinase
MSLTGRFSALFLAALGVVLVAFSTALYVSARVYLGRQVEDRLGAALAVLAAAAEVHVDGIEWEPQERILPLGQEPGPERLRWMVFDERGRRIDRSRNLVDREITESWTPRAATAELPSRLLDRSGRAWRVSQRRIKPDRAPPSGSRAGINREAAEVADKSGPVHASLVLSVCAPLSPVEATLTTLAWLLIGLSVATWLLAAFVCRRVSRRALAPLLRLVSSAKGLDAADQGWCLAEAGTGDELDELGRAFNDLLSRLHVAYERQRRFGSDASHQLRTPLTVLIGQLEVALRRERTGEEYRRTLHSALGRAIQLSQIIEALLFLGRAEGEAQRPELEPVELNHWVSHHLGGRVSSGPAAEIVHRASAGPLPNILVHPPLLGQLLDNLLDNALKYGPSDAPVIVETFQSGASVVLAVEDAGPGIVPEDVTRVFEPFYRSAQARRQGTPGAGLGLALVRQIASAFDATVSVQSQAKKGCRFEVRFPVRGVMPVKRSRERIGLSQEPH